MSDDFHSSSPSRTSIADRLIYIIGWACLSVFAISTLLIDGYQTHVRGFQAAWVIGFAGYGLIIYRLRCGSTVGAGAMTAWWAGMVLLRVVLLPTTPSDDLHRYMWEGRIQWSGHNPYVVAPCDPVLTPLRSDDPNWERINHPDSPGIYPPVAMGLFALVALVSPSVFAAKVVFVLLELVAIAALWRAGAARGAGLRWAAMYALCPLSLASIAMDGHLDALMLVTLAVGVMFAGRRRFVACGVALGLAMASKLVAVVLLPWLLLRSWRAGLLAIAIVMVSYLPYAGAGWSIFAPLVRFAGETQVMSFSLAVLTPLMPAPEARWLSAAILAGFILWAARRPRMESAATTSFLATLCVLPVVHFWYATWLLLFAGASRSWSGPLLAGLMGFYFEARWQWLTVGAWAMPAWVTWVVFLPTLVVATAGVLRRGADLDTDALA